MRKLIIGTAALLLAAGAGTASAGGFDLDAGIGYSRLNIDGKKTGDLDDNDGGAVHASIMWPQPAVPGLRLGFGLEVSGYTDRFRETDNDGDERTRYRSIDMLVPELRIAYRIPIDHFFIEPALGVGLAVADYNLHTNRGHDRDFDERDFDCFRLNAAVQPSVKIGYAQDRWAAGVELSYLWTHLHFKDEIGGDVSEMYVGGFFSWSF